MKSILSAPDIASPLDLILNGAETITFLAGVVKELSEGHKGRLAGCFLEHPASLIFYSAFFHLMPTFKNILKFRFFLR